jgi:transposase InsO family protein
VETVVKGINNIIVYIDDLLLHSKSHVEHREQLQEVFRRLRAHGLKANLKKCVFGSLEVNYLGFRLTPEGILPGPDKLKVVREAKPPSNVHEIRQFLGLCNFFRTHVRNFAQISGSLCQLTKKERSWRGGELPPDALKAFRELQSSLVSGPIVDYPRANRPYALIVDAALGDDKNCGGLGAILTQINERKEHCVIAYASRKLSAHEKNYTPYLLEMQACVWGIEHFCNYLRGRHFILYTDHKPLEPLGKVHTRTFNRLQELMTHYDFEICYKKGEEMPADFISRHAINSVSWDTNHLKEQQDQDPFLLQVKRFLLNRELPNGVREQQFLKFVANDCFVENDILWRRYKRKNETPKVLIMLPRSLVPQVVKEAHGQQLTGHDGIYKTKERLLQAYYWIGMDRDIAEHLQSCQKCQFRKSKVMPSPLLMTPLPQTTEPNQRVHADLFGPLKASGSQKKYILVITDAFTKYVELVAIPDKEACTVANAFFNRWICRYGVPLELITDQGREFVNKLSDEIFKLLGLQHHTTTARHPQCNAQAEVANKTIAKYLSTHVNETTLDWEIYIAPLMFAYNTSFHKSISNSPFFLTFGIEPRLPNFPAPELRRKFYGESEGADMWHRLLYARDLARRCNQEAAEDYKRFHDRKAQPHQFRETQWVLLDEHSFLGKNTKLAPKYSGPHQIVKVKGDHNLELKLSNGKHLVVNAERVKAYVFPPPTIEEPENWSTMNNPSEATPETKPSRQSKKKIKKKLGPSNDEEGEIEDYLAPPVRPVTDWITEEEEVHIKTEPAEVEVSAPIKRRGRPPKAKYWEPPPPPKPSTSTMLTRSQAAQLSQQSMENNLGNATAETVEINKVINHKVHLPKMKKMQLGKIPKGWTQAQFQNFLGTGDIYKGLYPRHTVTCEAAFSEFIPDPDSSSSSSDPDSDPDSDPLSESEDEVAILPDPVAPDPPIVEVESDSSGSSTPQPRSPAATDTEGEFNTPVGTSQSSSSDSDQTGGAAGPKPHEQTVLQRGPAKKTTITPDQGNIQKPAAKGTGLGGLLKDFGDYLVGTQPKAGPSHTQVGTGVPTAAPRSTRSAGPAPDIALPRVPIERGRGSTRSRGTSRASSTASQPVTRGSSRSSSRGSSGAPTTRKSPKSPPK